MDREIDSLCHNSLWPANCFVQQEVKAKLGIHVLFNEHKYNYCKHYSKHCNTTSLRLFQLYINRASEP